MPTPSPLLPVIRFNQALNDRDLDTALACLSDDTVFENTYPPPDGERYAGKAAVSAFWRDFLSGAEALHFETEEVFALGDRAVLRWRYTWTNAAGESGSIRGVDIYRVQGGLIVEKLSYVKG